MKKLIIIFGPPAVGKMSVGRELANLTGLKLLHNHATSELVLQFFDWSEPQFRLAGEFRMRLLEEVAASDLPGLIFTYVWALGEESDERYMDRVCGIFASHNAEIAFVELEADLAERLKRNKTDSRLREKPSKRDIANSEQLLLSHEKQNTFNSNGDFTYSDNYIKINNTNRSPAEVAALIVKRFGLTGVCPTCQPGIEPDADDGAD